ncbi:MAG: 4-alpha-glucanotransferase [Bulleidia sp.]|nr:4-alpha-glucanotransferase [Bulleidia sp.]
MNRSAGILMPITSLPSPYGVGTMGKAARQFIDFLHLGGQSYWQILPIGPTGYGDSPYQSFSTFAGNPYLIDLDDLKKDGWLKRSEYAGIAWGEDPAKVDYGTLYNNRFNVLRKAADRLNAEKPRAYSTFLKEHAWWLDDYALFMAEKYEHEGKSYTLWEDDIRLRRPEALKKETKRLSEEIRFWKAVQYFFFDQWKKMAAYAHANGVKIIGDVPIYVSPDSADLWANPSLFQLDRKGRPTEVAGCPPDGFSADGQLWGNPLYNWNAMKKDHYAWWMKRISHQVSLVDVLRIDHFRGFESYYAIPYGAATAKNGRWKKGPGISFFNEVKKQLGDLDIIAEDLGFLTPEVIEMVHKTGYPGMKVLEFAFDPRDTGSGYLPHKYTNNCVVYAGTHDNDTVMGWFSTADKEFTKRAIQYLHLDEKEGYNWGYIRGAYESVANLAVMQFQDILGLGSEARINTPSTTGGNWVWRCEPGAYNKTLARKLRSWTALYDRLPANEKTDDTLD